MNENVNFCPSCQRIFTTEIKFCISCGTSLMTKKLETEGYSYCESCRVIVLDDLSFCPQCGASLTTKKWKIEVYGNKSENVQKVAQSLMETVSDNPNATAQNTPWISGSFYLAAMVILVVLFLIVAKSVSLSVLPIVIVGSLISVSLIGAFQLRQDNSLSEKNFLSLMFLTFRQLPFIRRQNTNFGKKNSK